MTLKSKFICLGATLVIVVFAAEWLNYKNKEISDMQDTSVKVVQRHMDADMKHDGIRGNVYSALVATKTGDGALLKDSQEEVTNMSGEFAKDVQENIASNIPDDIKQQFEKIQKSVEDYASYSQKISHASGGFDGAVAMLPEFNKVFGVLEEGQGKATDMILTWSSKLSDTSQSFAHYLSYVLIAVLVAAIGLPIYAILAIFRPMAAMVNAMKALAGGDASVAIPYTHRTDEMGEMAKALQVFKDNALRIVALSEQSKIEHEHAEKQKRDSMNEIATNFETSVAAVVSQVASAALQMQTGSAVVVTASNEAAEMSRHVTQSSEEMMDAIREISSQTQKSSNIAVEASATAERARGTIEALAEKSNNVTEVISVISGIAGQINLLALNATIESARAGEAGKGFAVVASEVKNLANQVAKATGEITTQISEMQEATKSSVASVMQIVSIIDQVTNSASTVASAVEEQSAVMNGIATNVANTSASTQEISRNMTAVQTGAEKTGDTAWEVLEASKSLSEQANVLKAKVDEFLGTIRVA